MTPVCIIVGAGPGIGMAVARRFGREGFALALLARSAEKLHRAVDELAQAGITAWAYAADAGNPRALAGTLAQVAADHGQPSVLVYNAVALTPGPLAALDADTLLANVGVSTAGALAAVQAVLPAMQAQRAGTLIFTGGGAALSPIPNMVSLSVSKAALRLLALGLAQELAGSGIRVGTVTIFGPVAPGTPFDPDRIAEEYWRIHISLPQSDEVEISYRGEPPVR